MASPLRHAAEIATLLTPMENCDSCCKENSDCCQVADFLSCEGEVSFREPEDWLNASLIIIIMILLFQDLIQVAPWFFSFVTALRVKPGWS